ncbi:MAG: dihydropteroate synthase [Zwartia sp.]|jgi:dihydropteroate synthase
MSGSWLCGRFEFSLKRPLLMGVVNVTPDSFSDGGQHVDTSSAIAHAQKLVTEGADIIDIGGESTRPGALPVSIEQELARILPVMAAMRDCGAAISVDTCKPEVMQAALDAGADIINDVTGMRQTEAQRIVAAHPNCGVCLMHMQGEPRTMQSNPHYQNVVHEVQEALVAQAHLLERLGVNRARISLDPGLGFGKTLEHNYQLLHGLAQLVQSGYPVVLGASRKSLIGLVTGKPVDQRLSGSIAAALAGVARGVAVVRVHDVDATHDALKVWQAIQVAGDLS